MLQIRIYILLPEFDSLSRSHGCQTLPTTLYMIETRVANWILLQITRSLEIITIVFAPITFSYVSHRRRRRSRL